MFSNLLDEIVFSPFPAMFSNLLDGAVFSPFPTVIYLDRGKTFSRRVQNICRSVPKVNPLHKLDPELKEALKTLWEEE